MSRHIVQQENIKQKVNKVSAETVHNVEGKQPCLGCCYTSSGFVLHTLAKLWLIQLSKRAVKREQTENSRNRAHEGKTAAKAGESGAEAYLLRSDLSLSASCSHSQAWNGLVDSGLPLHVITRSSQGSTGHWSAVTTDDFSALVNAYTFWPLGEGQ
jgi:hypothetical protein